MVELYNVIKKNAGSFAMWQVVRCHDGQVQATYASYEHAIADAKNRKKETA